LKRWVLEKTGIKDRLWVTHYLSLDLFNHLFRVKGKFLLGFIRHVPEGDGAFLDLVVAENKDKVTRQVVGVAHLGLEGFCVIGVLQSYSCGDTHPEEGNEIIPGPVPDASEEASYFCLFRRVRHEHAKALDADGETDARSCRSAHLFNKIVVPAAGNECLLGPEVLRRDLKNGLRVIIETSDETFVDLDIDAEFLDIPLKKPEVILAFAA